MIPIQPVTLSSAVVVLEPLALAHVEALWAAASSGRETYVLTSVPSSLEGMSAFVEAALAEQERGVSIPFATRDARTGGVVGCTRFMNIERWSWKVSSALQRAPGLADAVEIGSTWLAPATQRTGINTGAKLLMLTHAFERWEVRRVTLKTDSRNARSRAAIERLGAKLDGVLRAHMPAFDGAVRDTAFYSILAAEWPAVKERLQNMAARTG